MSMVLKACGTDVLDNVFIFYDFKQVSDMIMLVAYIEKYDRWEKLFIYNIDDTWQIEALRQYFDERKFSWVCSKLELIFQNRVASAQLEIIDIDKEMQNESAFINALYAV